MISEKKCYEIYSKWLAKDFLENKTYTIRAESFVNPLLSLEIINASDIELIKAKRSNSDKTQKLFIEILPQKGDNALQQVIKIMKERNDHGILAYLNEVLEKENFSRTDYPNVPTGNVIPNNTSSRNQISDLLLQIFYRIYRFFFGKDLQMKQAQTHLSDLLKKNVDFMAKYWAGVIPLAQTEAAFVQVQVLEHFKSENGNPVGFYTEVFDNDKKTIHKRILIQADPGCGKTTYVNKLALDWANEVEYLRDKFDFVFLIPLQTLTVDVLDEIKCFLPDESGQFFGSYAKNGDSKILLILDGFDELVENSEWYSSVMGILEGKSMQFQFYHIIITTRRSHVDKIPKQFHGRSLLIKGFDQQSMKQFLIKQNVPFPSVGQESNLSHLLQTPLFCAIYCSLHFGSGDPIELEDSYDLIKALVDNSVTKTVANVEELNEQLDEIGKFAFQMLDSESLNFLKKFCRSSDVIKPSFDLSRVNLDLLIKRRIPTRGVGRFKEEFSLPHQLIAEYLAARYFACSLTEEQAKHADASALIPVFSYRVSDLPFVRFFLFELLLLYLDKKYDESVFDNFLNIPEIRFFWNIKSNKDIPTIDNVIHLYFNEWNSELRNHSRFIPTLSKCQHLSSLSLSYCGLLKNQVEQLVNFINNNCFQKLIELYLGLDENVGSTPQLFTALSKCKHLEALDLEECDLTVKSTTELARCIDNNGLVNLKKLQLEGNKTVGSSIDLFYVLHKCPQLQMLSLERCSMTEKSLKIFLSLFNSNTFQHLDHISLWGNEEIKVDDNFFTALEKCRKISKFWLSKKSKSNLSEVGRKAKETLEQRGCQFQFDDDANGWK